jgi:hypothetical protein
VRLLLAAPHRRDEHVMLLSRLMRIRAASDDAGSSSWESVKFDHANRAALDDVILHVEHNAVLRSTTHPPLVANEAFDPEVLDMCPLGGHSTMLAKLVEQRAGRWRDVVREFASRAPHRALLVVADDCDIVGHESGIA